MKRRTRANWAVLLTSVPLLAVAACSASHPAAGTTVTRDHISARLIAETRSLVPGTLSRIGLLFEIDPGWHLFGPMRNDSGLPLRVEPRAPEGFGFRSPLWPAPQRMISEGSVLDHVYRNRVTVILPLEVPVDARPGQTVTLSCRADWLVCGDACIPESAILEITLPIGVPADRSRPSTEAVLIRESLERIPNSIADAGNGVTQDWSDRTWSVRVADATGLAFYPDERCAPLEDPIRDAVSTNDRLRLRLAPDAGSEARIVGVLEITRPRGPNFLSIDSPRPARGT